MKSFLTIIIVPFLLFGCTYFNPLIKNVEYKPSSLDDVKLKKTKIALEDINSSLKDTIKKRDDNIGFARSLDIATFGLGTAAAGYGLRSGHVNAIKNLAFASGATYIGSTLFASNDTTLIYDKAGNSLACIYNAGESFHTFVNSSYSISNKDSNSKKVTSEIKVCESEVSVISLLEIVNKKFDAIEANDSAIAHDLRSAASKVIDSTNTLIIQNSPSPASIFNTSQLASKFNTLSTSGEQKNAVVARSLDTKCKPEETRLEKLSKDIDNQINTLSGIAETCVLNLPSTNTDLHVANTEVTLSSNDKHILEVTGGKPPYKITLSENKDEFSAITLPTSFLLLTKTITTSTTTPLTATINDSSTIAKTKEIIINLKK